MYTLSPNIAYTKRGLMLFGLTATGQYGDAILEILMAHGL